MMVHTPIAEASSEVTDFGSIEGMPVSEDPLSSELLLRGTRTAFMSGGGETAIGLSESGTTRMADE